MGEAYRKAEQYEEAITEFKRAIQVNPHYLEAHDSLACTYALTNRGNEAEAESFEVYKIDPTENFAKSLPYKEGKDLDCVIEAMPKAGLK